MTSTVPMSLRSPRPPHLVLLSLSLFVSATAQLIQVQVIHRHGARPHLIKHPSNVTDESRPGRLYPGGVRQMQNLGKYIHDTYIAGPNNSRILDIGKEFVGRGDLFAWSSNFHRTLVSSRVILNELYLNRSDFYEESEGEIFPTLVFGNRFNDWILRGYAICPTLTQKFEDFLDSDEFKDKNDDSEDTEETNAEFMKRIASSLKSPEVEDQSLGNAFTIYDRYLLIKNNGYGARRFPDARTKKLSDGDFERLRKLADWVESSKYDFDTHKMDVASGLLGRLMGEMDRKTSGDEKVRPPPHRLVEYSAHYPTLLTLLAALRSKSGKRRARPADRIPGFGAALLLELHKEEGKGHFVKLKWYAGDGSGEEDDEITVEEFGLGKKPCETEKDRCSLEDFRELVNAESLGSESFCKDCESGAEVCLREDFQSGGGCSTGTKVLSGFIGWLFGLVVGLVATMGYMRCSTRRKWRDIEVNGDQAGPF